MACIFLLALLCLSTFHSVTAQMQIERRTYIVHVNIPTDQVLGHDREKLYSSFLPETIEKSRVRHMYRNVIRGFAANLSPNEVKEMEKMEWFVHAWPEKTYTLSTTESPRFLGLSRNVGSWPDSNYGKGVIIGVIDSGITPGHPSFSDEGVPPPPERWKGNCELNRTFCNNKLIGARNFVGLDPGPPVDKDGHGTHTAGIATGNFVLDAGLLGQAKGTASGMSPLAHLAIYKVCRQDLCLESDIMAGMEAAIEDGVDVLSLSIGGTSSPFYEDGIAIGAFSAMRNGIFVSCAANNNGPSNFSLANEAPWILTVGASTIDRQIVTKPLLGNMDEYEGQSVYQPWNFPSKLLPLVYAELCGPEPLNTTAISGKVALCLRGGGVSRIGKGQAVKDAGGAAMILMNDEADAFSTLADAHVLPASHVSYDAGQKIKAYMNSTTTPMATILFQGTSLGDKTAPTVASFSSRGPSLASPGILKPDIIGPGASILSAWPVLIDNNYVYRNTNNTFNMMSGTSMSCPHLSGIAALIKSAHPDWSPAMIKSAIMTSATQSNHENIPILDQNLVPAGVFAIGAGHVNPPKALDPGLVYDLSTRDYISYLCFLYTEEEVAVIVNQKIDCSSSEYKGAPEAQLNYPSFAIQLGDTVQNYSRTVTNVGDANSTYEVLIESVRGVEVIVKPKKLSFEEVKQRKRYEVYFRRLEELAANGSYVQGSIAWVSQQHTVRIPVSVHFV